MTTPDLPPLAAFILTKNDMLTDIEKKHDKYKSKERDTYISHCRQYPNLLTQTVLC